MTDYQNILNTINQSVRKENDKGKIASYIPELANVDINNFGIHL
jgi:glutaminase